jgi:DNA-binding IclR family transcriptional regulator
MRLQEVATSLGLSPPTAYQRLLTLTEAGLIEQDEKSHYRLSMHLCRFAAAALEQADLGTRVLPILQELVNRVKETASLAVLDRGLPCNISRVESDRILRAEQKIGTTMSLEGSASGRILTAFADETTMRRLKESGEEMASEEIIAAARRERYAVSSGYTQIGVRALAAPVFDMHDKCIATLSLVMPETRFDLDQFIAPLLSATEEINRLYKGLR